MPTSGLTRRELIQRAALMAASGLPALVGLPARAASGEISPVATPAVPGVKPTPPTNPQEILKLLAIPPDAERQWQLTGRADPAFASFDRLIGGFMAARHITGAALAVTRQSRLVYARGYRWDRPGSPEIRPDTPFRIASLSKPLTSAGIFWLARQGKLLLSNKLLDLVPMTPRPGKSADPRLKTITILNLLQHQGGWDRDRSFDPMFHDFAIATDLNTEPPLKPQQIIRYMAGQPLDFLPGARYAYSNFGYCLLGRVIEAVTGRPYGEFMREAIFATLGIKRIRLGATEFARRLPEEPYYRTRDNVLHPSVFVHNAPAVAPDPYGAWNLENMDAHGGWLASAVDLARFMTAFDPTGGYPLLGEGSLRKIFSCPATGMDHGAYYGCGWQVRPAGKSQNTWHIGSLPGTFTLMVRRHDGLNWVILFNQRDDPSGLAYDDIDDILHRAANQVEAWPDHDLFGEYNLPTA